ncbi:MAG: glucose-6-phosphate dehydrogenase [Candidatus Gracilibacteria bacterium]|jgi:glucose-6-phosphate 1-dehydrogenase
MDMKKIPFQMAEHDFSLVIFGASGSLAKLKLFPALYELVKEGRMPKDFKIIGFARTKMSDAEFRKSFAEAIKKNEKDIEPKTLKKLLDNVFYFSGDYKEKEDYKAMLKRLKEVENAPSRVRMAYFSVPPSVFPGIFSSLAAVSFNTKKAPLRLVIEKPFGYDLKSAKALKTQLEKFFKPEQIFLLDHYLGKEAVSNLLSLRYANSLLTNLFSKEFVSNIQITALEEKDIEGRANYFDHVGILRDMVQSHLLQILAYLTMHAPKQKTAEAIHHEKAKVLKSLKIGKPHDCIVRGQYKGYNKEKGIPESSQTETYAALKLTMDHPLWKGVPIFIRSGKCLKKKWTAVVLELKPHQVQKEAGITQPNRIVIQLQPYEKIEFHLLTKLGGKTFDFHPLTTGRPIYCSGDCIGEHGRLLLDAVAGKNGLFLNFEEIFAAWQVMDKAQSWCDIESKKCAELYSYDCGSLGPKQADELLAKDGFTWFNALPQ